MSEEKFEAERFFKEKNWEIDAAIRHIAMLMPMLEINTLDDLEDLFEVLTEENTSIDFFDDKSLKQKLLNASKTCVIGENLLNCFKEKRGIFLSSLHYFILDCSQKQKYEDPSTPEEFMRCFLKFGEYDCMNFKLLRKGYLLNYIKLNFDQFIQKIRKLRKRKE